MTKRNKRSRTVEISGKSVPILVAALIAQEADRLKLLPRQVGDVVIPQPAPSTVTLAGLRLSLVAGAQLAAEADARGILIEQLMGVIVTEQTEALERRARRSDTKQPLEGVWDVRPTNPLKN